MKPYGIIYKATNIINNKSYVGKTIRTLEKRINEHKKANYKTYFCRAIDKYGVENFKWEILKENVERKMLGIMETFMIMVHHTYRSEGGYNCTWGGEGGDTFTNNPNKEIIRKKSMERASKYWKENPDKYEEFRKSSSKRMKNNNPMKNPITAKSAGKKISMQRKNKTYEELYDKETSYKIKSKASDRMKNNNPMKNQKTIEKMLKTAEKNGSYKNRIMSQEGKNKISLGNAKKWEITYPSGQKEIISNLLRFCKKNNLNDGHMNQVSKGLRKTHKGFKCKKL